MFKNGFALVIIIIGTIGFQACNTTERNADQISITPGVYGGEQAGEQSERVFDLFDLKPDGQFEWKLYWFDARSNSYLDSVSMSEFLRDQGRWWVNGDTLYLKPEKIAGLPSPTEPIFKYRPLLDSELQPTNTPPGKEYAFPIRNIAKNEFELGFDSDSLQWAHFRTSFNWPDPPPLVLPGNDNAYTRR